MESSSGLNSNPSSYEPPSPTIQAPPPPEKEKAKDNKKERKNHKKRRFEDKYIMGEDIIGEGATAVVKICTNKEGEEFAVKIMDRKQVCMDDKKFNEEILVLSRLRHHNIIRLYDVYKTKDKIMVITELAAGGELFDRLLEQNTFKEKDAAKITRRLFDAIRHMHEQGICHRDLKPENIMFKNTSKNSSLKIVDFGFASSLLDKKKKFQTMSQLGTMGYAAPEIFTGKAYTEKCDVWSLGVIVYILLCGFPPFVDMRDETKEDVMNTPFWVYVNKMQTAYLDASSSMKLPLDFPEQFWKHVSPAAKDFLKQVLVVDPRKRPSASEALKHSWLHKDSASHSKHLNLTLINMRKFKTLKSRSNTMSLGNADLNKLHSMFKLLTELNLPSPPAKHYKFSKCKRDLNVHTRERSKTAIVAIVKELLGGTRRDMKGVDSEVEREAKTI
ncbi:hypothetical protein AAMO2058_001233800 [Amorphochlora amoebiformis]